MIHYHNGILKIVLDFFSFKSTKDKWSVLKFQNQGRHEKQNKR